eukprot:5824172-Amphidinium_carterae.1
MVPVVSTFVHLHAKAKNKNCRFEQQQQNFMRRRDPGIDNATFCCSPKLRKREAKLDPMFVCFSGSGQLWTCLAGRSTA